MLDGKENGIGGEREELQAKLAELEDKIAEFEKENKDLKNSIIDLSIRNSQKKRERAASFSQAFQRNDKYISFKWNHYLPIYDRILAYLSKQEEPMVILEIGVNNGGSLEIWKQLLPEGSKIYGVDIDEKCNQLQFSDGINFILGDATDPNFIQEHFAHVRFDIIIDDGSHLSHQVIKSFEQLFLRVKFGGLYIVEDVHTSYFKRYNGGFRAPYSHMEYFKRALDSINLKFIEKEDVERVSQSELNYLRRLNEEIACISFYDSIIVLEKYAYRMERNFSGIVTRGEGHVLTQLEDFPRFDENSEVLDCYRK